MKRAILCIILLALAAPARSQTLFSASQIRSTTNDFPALTVQTNLHDVLRYLSNDRAYSDSLILSLSNSLVGLIVAPTGTAASVDADLQDHKTKSIAHSTLFASVANQTNGSFASTSYVAAAVGAYIPTNSLPALTNGFVDASITNGLGGGSGSSMTTQTVYDLSGAVVSSSNLVTAANVTNDLDLSVSPSLTDTVAKAAAALPADLTNGWQVGPHLDWVTNGGVIYGWTNGPDLDWIIVSDSVNGNTNAFGVYSTVDLSTNNNGWIYSTAAGGIIAAPNPQPAETKWYNCGDIPPIPSTNWLGVDYPATGSISVAYATKYYQVTMISTSGIDGQFMKTGSIPFSALTPAAAAAATNLPTPADIGAITSTPAGIIGAGGATGTPLYVETQTLASLGGMSNTTAALLDKGAVTGTPWLAGIAASNLAGLFIGTTCSIPYVASFPAEDQQFYLYSPPTNPIFLAFDASWASNRHQVAPIAIYHTGSITFVSISIKTNLGTWSATLTNMMIFNRPAYGTTWVGTEYAW